MTQQFQYGRVTMAEKQKISLVLADVDGTLVTTDKILTRRTLAAVKALDEAGIHFAITSGRPPRGMVMLFDPLELVTPIAGFNGGIYVDRSLTILARNLLPANVSREAIYLLRRHGLDVWVYCGNDWFITQLDAPRVAREGRTVRFGPKVVANFDDKLAEIAKIVGVSDDLDRVKRCEADADAVFVERATSDRSRPYYLDITSRDANKGVVMAYLSEHLNVPAGQIATIGDQLNDVMMFKRSGLSIAMGNAPDEVKAQATSITDPNDNDGFAKAIERFVLG